MGVGAMGTNDWCIISYQNRDYFWSGDYKIILIMEFGGGKKPIKSIKILKIKMSQTLFVHQVSGASSRLGCM